MVKAGVASQPADTAGPKQRKTPRRRRASCVFVQLTQFWQSLLRPVNCCGSRPHPPALLYRNLNLQTYMHKQRRNIDNLGYKKLLKKKKNWGTGWSEMESLMTAKMNDNKCSWKKKRYIGQTIIDSVAKFSVSWE